MKEVTSEEHDKKDKIKIAPGQFTILFGILGATSITLMNSWYIESGTL